MGKASNPGETVRRVVQMRIKHRAYGGIITIDYSYVASVPSGLTDKQYASYCAMSWQSTLPILPNGTVSFDDFVKNYKAAIYQSRPWYEGKPRFTTQDVEKYLTLVD